MALAVGRTDAADAGGQKRLKEETEIMGGHGYVPSLQSDQKGKLRTREVMLTRGLGAALGYARGKGGFHHIGTRMVTFNRVQNR